MPEDLVIVIEVAGNYSIFVHENKLVRLKQLRL